MLYIVKQQNGFSALVYNGFLPEDIDMSTIIETNEETINKLHSYEYMWENYTIVKNPQYIPRNKK